MPLIERYRLAFDISPVPMVLVSNEGKIILVNDGLNELFEYEGDDLVGQSVEQLVPKASRAHHPELRNAYYRFPTKRSMGAGRDLNGITSSGKIIPLELGLEPITNDGETMAMVVVLDIRQRKAHEERMHLAMDAAASAMVMVNADGLIVFVNNAAALLFGYEEKELLRQPVEMLVPKEFQRAHPVYIGSFMSESQARSMGLGRDLFARRRDGSQIPVEIALTPVDSPDGKMVMSTIIDLSERVAAANAVAAKSEELVALNTELSHFAYSASHDLKAPLSSITGLLKICMEDLHDNNIEEVRENLNKVLDISLRSAQKVEGVLKIASAGRDALETEPIQLEPLIHDIWTDLTGDMNARIELSLELKHKDPVITELPTLKLIFENLLSNAYRYGDSSKSRHIIEITSRSEEDVFHATVTDNGIGVPEKNQKQVFEMFKRIDERSGDGLGLTLVQKQIDRMGGSITFSSIEGEGTQFTFKLPLDGTKENNDTSSNRG